MRGMARKRELLERYHAVSVAQSAILGFLHVRAPRMSERPCWPSVWRDKDKPGIAYANKDALPVRWFANVIPESYGRSDGTFWTNDKNMTGWYADPSCDIYNDGTGLCWGVVYQLTAKQGRARYVAGYQMGGTDDGPVLDLSKIFIMKDHNAYNHAFYGEEETDPSAYEAAKWADTLAMRAAEDEQEHQREFQQGNDA